MQLKSFPTLHTDYAIAVVADVSEFEQVKAIADQTVAVYGRLDTWVHLSGTSVVAPFEPISPEEFKRIIDLTLPTINRRGFLVQRNQRGDG